MAKKQRAFFEEENTEPVVEIPSTKTALFNQTTHIHNTDTQHGYTIQEEESRSKRMQIVVKPSTFDKLEEYTNAGIIKSKNDLVNFLLEAFIKQQG